MIKIHTFSFAPFFAFRAPRSRPVWSYAGSVTEMCRVIAPLKSLSPRRWIWLHIKWNQKSQIPPLTSHASLRRAVRIWFARWWMRDRAGGFGPGRGSRRCVCPRISIPNYWNVAWRSGWRRRRASSGVKTGAAAAAPRASCGGRSRRPGCADAQHPNQDELTTGKSHLRLIAWGFKQQFPLKAVVQV